VITIIGILVALITVAAVGALKTARQTEIKTEVSQLDTGVMESKNKTTAFPPNCQTDGNTGPLDELQVFNDLKRYMKQAFPRHQEPPELIARLVGLAPTGAQLSSGQGLQGGMAAGEALVFWLGGFSSDPKYPISGDGGPSYRIQAMGNAQNRTLDPIESRTWTFPFDVGRLGPRADDNYFDDTDMRFIEYDVRINGQQQFRRINFWQYVPRKSEQPYLYFDTSRHPAAVLVGSNSVARFDPPAATQLSPFALHVHAFKKASDAANSTVPIQFVNPDKFQIIHCGIDDAWDEAAFERMSCDTVTIPTDFLLFPTGPFIGEIADTIVNFTQETTIEDAQP
jgi:hypothetical protein